MFKDEQTEALKSITDFYFDKLQKQDVEGLMVIMIGKSSTYRCLRNFSPIEVVLALESVLEICYQRFPHSIVHKLLDMIIERLDKIDDEPSIEKAVNAARLLMKIIGKDEADEKV